jgi:hypothetical protein
VLRKLLASESQLLRNDDATRESQPARLAPPTCSGEVIEKMLAAARRSGPGSDPAR